MPIGDRTTPATEKRPCTAAPGAGRRTSTVGFVFATKTRNAALPPTPTPSTLRSQMIRGPSLNFVVSRSKENDTTPGFLPRDTGTGRNVFASSVDAWREKMPLAEVTVPAIRAFPDTREPGRGDSTAAAGGVRSRSNVTLTDLPLVPLPSMPRTSSVRLPSGMSRVGMVRDQNSPPCAGW